jgi:hypothetical protein
MKAVVFVALLGLILGSRAIIPSFQDFRYFDHTFYWPWSFGTFYAGGQLGSLPALTDDQICYAIGANSGCSGCELGSLGLCRYASVENPFFAGSTHQRFFTCVHKDLAASFALAESKTDADFLTQKGVYDFRLEGHLCPADPTDAPIIRAPLWTADPLDAAAFPTQYIGWEHTSLIHNTYHEMTWADVPVRPWAVDRTSAFGDAGVTRLWALATGALLGPFPGIMNRDPQLGRIDCAALNDREQMSVLIPARTNPTIEVDTVLNNLMLGIVNNPRSRWCANLIYGAYLSTRCPEYGKAVSGIAESLFMHFTFNCQRDNHVAPLLILPSGSPFATFPYFAVPDATSWALHEVPITPNERWEEWLEIDEVDVEWDQDDIAHIFGHQQYTPPIP